MCTVMCMVQTIVEAAELVPSSESAVVRVPKCASDLVTSPNAPVSPDRRFESTVRTLGTCTFLESFARRQPPVSHSRSNSLCSESSFLQTPSTAATPEKYTSRKPLVQTKPEHGQMGVDTTDPGDDIPIPRVQTKDKSGGDAPTSGHNVPETEVGTPKSGHAVSEPEVTTPKSGVNAERNKVDASSVAVSEHTSAVTPIQDVADTPQADVHAPHPRVIVPHLDVEDSKSGVDAPLVSASPPRPGSPQWSESSIDSTPRSLTTLVQTQITHLTRVKKPIENSTSPDESLEYDSDPNSQLNLPHIPYRHRRINLTRLPHPKTQPVLDTQSPLPVMDDPVKALSDAPDTPPPILPHAPVPSLPVSRLPVLFSAH